VLAISRSVHLRLKVAMQRPCFVRRVWSILLVGLSVAAVAAELPSVSVELATGRKMRAVVDTRTDRDRLWLRFGSGDTYTRRGFEWQFISQITEGDRTLAKNELIQRAAAEREQMSSRPQRQLVVRTSASPSDLPARVEPAVSSHAGRIVAVTFDVTLANWDSDVMTDGLEFHVTAWNAQREPVAVRGTLTAELFSMKRVEQDEIRHGRGRDLRRMERWSKQVDLQPDPSSAAILRLPFQTPYPEFDVDWAPFGLVHIQLVAPGHGVFHHSIDGLRIRPWAPLRDMLEMQTGKRYFPSEFQ
jgi:hypothetical protein